MCVVRMVGGGDVTGHMGCVLLKVKALHLT